MIKIGGTKMGVLIKWVRQNSKNLMTLVKSKKF